MAVVLVAVVALLLVVVVVVLGKRAFPAPKHEHPTSPADDVHTTAASLESALSDFHDQELEYPASVDLGPGNVTLHGSDSSSRVEDDRLRKGVRLAWYVAFADPRRPVDPGKDPGPGYSYCLAKAGYYSFASTDQHGQVVSGPTKGHCPSKPTR